MDSLAAGDWEEEFNWCNPPFRLLDQVVALLARCRKVRAIVVAPLWKSATWFSPLLRMAVEYEVLQPRHDMFLPGDLGSRQAVGPPPWPVVVALVVREA